MNFIQLCDFYLPGLVNEYQEELAISHLFSGYRAFRCLHFLCFLLPFFPIVSQPDCYVSLWLPTASDEKFHTQTIKNCRNPVWNETFYFRIQRRVKVHEPKVLFFISSLCNFFQFSPKQDVMSSNAFLSSLKIPLASWSKTIKWFWLFLESTSLLTEFLFIYQ